LGLFLNESPISIGVGTGSSSKSSIDGKEKFTFDGIHDLSIRSCF